ncbi:MAG: hypothetical protein HYU84_00575 [Chloroflexi bacterium]|nr:hypothetical protein [Chloroflexota bacterium]
MSNNTSKVLAIGIVLIQILDILIHAATDQLSNVVILVWPAIVLSGKFNAKFLQAAISSIGLYLILNGIFLAREGLTNPEQGGEPRVMLFVLVILTALLSIILAFKRPRND